MNHRISAGAFVEHDGRILLVRHLKASVYDFWVAPGGGVQGTEDLATTAVREVKEETGLDVSPGKLLYIEEFHSPHTRYCKMWFNATLLGGELSITAPEAVSESIVQAAWFTEPEIRTLQVFPQMLTGRYWEDRAAGFPGTHHIGLREMAFW